MQDADETSICLAMATGSDMTNGGRNYFERRRNSRRGRYSTALIEVNSALNLFFVAASIDFGGAEAKREATA